MTPTPSTRSAGSEGAEAPDLRKALAECVSLMEDDDYGPGTVWAMAIEKAQAALRAAPSSAPDPETDELCAECGGRRCPTCGQGCVDAVEAHP